MAGNETAAQKHFVLPGQILTWIIEYLRKRPYEEVAGVMGVLSSLPAITIASEADLKDQPDAGEAS